MSSKADRLGSSTSFDTYAPAPAASSNLSDRGRAIAGLTGEVVPVVEISDGAVAIGLVDLNPYNPRSTVAAVQDMADSIEQIDGGLITPLAVVTRSAFLAAYPEASTLLAAAAQYVVVDGNRRLAGARLAGVERVPIHVDDRLAADRDAILKAVLIADAQHENLPHLDQAKALQAFVTAHGSQRKAARALGKSQSWISKRTALMGLAPELAATVRDGRLAVDVAAKVGQLPHSEQAAALERELTARQEGKARVSGDSDGITSEPSPPAKQGRSAGDSDGITRARAGHRAVSDSDGITPAASTPAAVPHQAPFQEPSPPAKVSPSDSDGITGPADATDRWAPWLPALSEQVGRPVNRAEVIHHLLDALGEDDQLYRRLLNRLQATPPEPTA